MAKDKKDVRVKEEKKAAKAAKKEQRKQTRSQLWQAFKLQKGRDKKLIPYMVLAFLIPVVLMLLLRLVVAEPDRGHLDRRDGGDVGVLPPLAVRRV